MVEGGGGVSYGFVGGGEERYFSFSILGHAMGLIGRGAQVLIIILRKMGGWRYLLLIAFNLHLESNTTLACPILSINPLTNPTT